MPRPLLALSLMLSMLPLAATAADSRNDSAATIDVAFNAERIGGAVVSCFVSARVIVKDFADKGGAPVLVTADVGVVKPNPNALVSYIRVFPSDLAVRNGAVAKMTPFKPSFAYAEFSGFNTGTLMAIPNTCGADGGYCTGYPAEAALTALASIVTTRRLAVIYQRHQGGLDVPVPVDISSDSPKADEAMHAFATCNGALAAQIMNH